LGGELLEHAPDPVAARRQHVVCVQIVGVADPRRPLVDVLP